MIKIRLIIQIMVIFLMIYKPCKHLKKNAELRCQLYLFLPMFDKYFA